MAFVARGLTRPVAAPRVVAGRASKVAEPASLPVKSFAGADVGTADLALKVAGDDTARHVVHRYLVLVNQNARQVRPQPRAVAGACPRSATLAHPGCSDCERNPAL